MTKRKTPRSDDFYDGFEDDPIGLTNAFETIKDPQSVEYDEGDQAIGLTEAFAHVRDTGERTWSETDKWNGFDWSSDWDESTYSYDNPDDTEAQVDVEDAELSPSASAEVQQVEDDALEPPESESLESSDGATAKQTENDVADQAEEDALKPTSNDAVEPSASVEAEERETPTQAEESVPDKKRTSTSSAASTDATSKSSVLSETHEINVAKDLAHASAAASHSVGPKRGRHAAYSQELTPRMKKSRRTRNALIAVVILLIAGAAVLGAFAFHTVKEGQEEAEHQAQEQLETTHETTTETEADDAVETATQHADVPNLTSLLGKSSKTAIKKLKRGAIVSSNQTVKDKKSAIKTNLTVALADEPADSKTGTPSVYLGLNKKGKIIQAGYSASASALGFGSLSFADAISNEHVIEKTLAQIGVDVKEGSVKLPKNRAKYATYASDKTTVVKERCSFDGDIDIDGVPCTWSAVLSYDYTTQVITGDLSDTVRIIYVYITQK